MQGKDDEDEKEKMTVALLQRSTNSNSAVRDMALGGAGGL